MIDRDENFAPPVTEEQYAEVASFLGHAVWQIQVLEETLAVYLVLAHKLNPKTARSDVEAMFAKASKQTLGRLLGAIRNAGKDPSDLLPRLERFVDERNWLIHRSRHENRKDLRSPSQRLQLTARINAVSDEALSLMTAFQDAMTDELIRRGMNRVQVEARAAEIYREWTTPGN